MIQLDLPTPPSVNRTRRVDWAGHKKLIAWSADCHKHLIYQGIKVHKAAISGRYEATIIIPEGFPIDPDNGVKAILDYIRRVELVTDDSGKYLRRVTVEFGEAPRGVRIVLKEFDN